MLAFGKQNFKQFVFRQLLKKAGDSEKALCHFSF